MSDNLHSDYSRNCNDLRDFRAKTPFCREFEVLADYGGIAWKMEEN